MPKKTGRGRGRQPTERSSSCFQGLRAALRSGAPLDLLAVVSGLLEVTDPRSRDPFAPNEQRTSLGDLGESFVGTPYAETTAALTAIRTLSTDEVLEARIERELASRRYPSFTRTDLAGRGGAERASRNHVVETYPARPLERATLRLTAYPATGTGEASRLSGRPACARLRVVEEERLETTLPRPAPRGHSNGQPSASLRIQQPEPDDKAFAKDRQWPATDLIREERRRCE